jgi:glycerol-3-phosphate acyltransferase PlsX
VCDAVLGNVVMKFFEGLSLYIFDIIRAEFRSSLRGKLAGLLFQPSVARIRAQFDPEVVGGSPLLGVNGTLVITHGSAKRRMVWFALETTATAIRERVNDQIAASLGLSGTPAEEAGSNDALSAAEAE